MAKGLLPDDHPQSAAAARSYVIGNADVVLVAGARLNWLLSHGRRRCGTRTRGSIQVDISPTEIDSNRAIAAPVVGDIKSVFAAFNAALKPGQVKRQAAWIDEIGKRKQQNIERMAARLNADPSPMNFSSALRAVRNALADPAGCLYRQRGRQHARFRPQHHRHGPAAPPPRQRHLGGHGHRHGLCGRRRGGDRQAGRRDRGRQRLRLQRHGDRDDLPLRIAGDDDHLQQ